MHTCLYIFIEKNVIKKEFIIGYGGRKISLFKLNQIGDNFYCLLEKDALQTVNVLGLIRQMLGSVKF